MAGGASYQRFPQKPAPSSEAIGAALMQQQGMMQPGMGPAGAGAFASPTGGLAAPDGTPMGGQAPLQAPGDPTALGVPSLTDQTTASMGDPVAASLRLQGAQRMGPQDQHGAAESPDPSGHSANALNISVGEALTRLGNGYSTNTNPYKDGAAHSRQLQQLGLSPVEAALLTRTGGV